MSVVPVTTFKNQSTPHHRSSRLQKTSLISLEISMREDVGFVFIFRMNLFESLSFPLIYSNEIPQNHAILKPDERFETRVPCLYVKRTACFDEKGKYPKARVFVT
jgi:hypothetical protein